MRHRSGVTQGCQRGRSDNAGSDLGPLLDQLAALERTGEASMTLRAVLGAAAEGSRRWLRALLGQLVPAGATEVDDTTATLLARVAAYRDRWHVTHLTPLGTGATSEEQARERRGLMDTIDRALAAPQPAMVPEPPLEAVADHEAVGL
jgi:hypothetical protein